LGIFSGLCCLLVYSTVSWQSAVIGFVLGMASLMPFYLLRMLGAGDVKLFGVVGLFLGYEVLISVLMSTAIAGGVLAILYLLKQVIINIITKVPITFGIKSLQLPYAVAISLGTLSVLMNLQITL
jgi:prepilin peptidase CpaA